MHDRYFVLFVVSLILSGLIGFIQNRLARKRMGSILARLALAYDGRIRGGSCFAFFPDQLYPRLSFSRNNRSFCLSINVGTGKHPAPFYVKNSPFVQLCMSAHLPFEAYFIVHERGIWNTDLGRVLLAETRTGNPVFDQSYVVKGDNRQAIQAVLTAASQERLLAARYSRIAVRIRRETMTVTVEQSALTEQSLRMFLETSLALCLSA